MATAITCAAAGVRIILNVVAKRKFMFVVGFQPR
jgi:hypothetical protein